MKSISDYMNESDGTGPAVGKEFTLYGMSIGKLTGAYASSSAALVFEKNGEKMEVPVTIKLPQFNLPGPIFNPLLEEIKEV
jgi:hypothetical protein